MLYGGQEELSDEDMERIRAAFGADAALLASGDPAELGDAVVGQTGPR